MGIGTSPDWWSLGSPSMVKFKASTRQPLNICLRVIRAKRKHVIRCSMQWNKGIHCDTLLNFVISLDLLEKKLLKALAELGLII